MNAVELREVMECLECGLRGRLDEILNVVKPRIEETTVQDAVAEVLRSKVNRGLRRTYINTLRSCLGIFATAFAGLLMSQITAMAIETWLKDERLNMETRRGYLKNVRTLFSFAVKHRWVVRNVALDVDWPEPEPSAPGILTVPEVARLMAACERTDQAFCSWLAVQLFGGLRVNEAIHIPAAAVNCRTIEVGGSISKTRRRRLVGINGTLRAWLDVGGPLPVVNWRKRLDAVKLAAGIPWPRNCLRHSFVSYAFPILGARETAIQAGHSESVLFSRYRELVTHEQAEAFWRIMPAAGRQMELFG